MRLTLDMELPTLTVKLIDQDLDGGLGRENGIPEGGEIILRF